MEKLQQLTLHVGSGIDASFVSDVLLESFGAYSSTIADRNRGTAEEQILCHAVDATSLQNVLVDSNLRSDLPIWTEAVITAFFPPDCCLESITMSLLSDFDLPLPAIDAGPVAEEFVHRNWVAHVQHAFSAVTIGTIRVRAPWHDPPTASSAVRDLLLDPGMAFGTGEHPTTQLVVNWLQTFSAARAGHAEPWTVLDYGCGTGILAIAAVLCGATEAVGCDLDAKAVETGAENAAANMCGDKVRITSKVREAAIFEEEGLYDVVVANILASTLKELAPTLCARVAAGGVLVLSGILAEQAPAVSTVFARQGVAMEGANVQAGWTLLVGRRRCDAETGC